MVSILTPTYNSARFIKATIESILSQTYSNWELLVTDDCSTDNTWEILTEYAQKDSRIKIFRLSKNSGAGIARNNSISHASGRFIAFCDSDDLWLPEKLEKQLNFMTKRRCSLSFSSYNRIRENGDFICTVVAKSTVTYKQMLRNNYIPCLTAMYDTKSLGKVFMPDICKRQDWALWLKMLKQLNSAFGMQDVLAIYKVRHNSLSNNKLNLLKYNWNIYRKLERFSVMQSYLLMLQFLFFHFSYKLKAK